MDLILLLNFIFTCYSSQCVLVQDTLDAVETLLKKHEAFERAAATQEERFLALERITTVSEHCTVSLQH